MVEVDLKIQERWDDKPQLIIADSTGKGGALFKERKGLWSSGFRTNSKNKPADDTERDFMLKLESECAVEMGMENAPSYRLISRKEVDEIFKKNDGWKSFTKGIRSHQVFGVFLELVITQLQMRHWYMSCTPAGCYVVPDIYIF